MIKNFVKSLELVGDRLEVCVSVYELANTCIAYIVCFDSFYCGGAHIFEKGNTCIAYI